MWKAPTKWWVKAALIGYAYYFSCVALFASADFVFVFDSLPARSNHSPAMTKVILSLIFISIIVFSVIVSNQKVPESIKAIAISIFLAYLLYTACYYVIVQRQFEQSALQLWMIVLGFFSYMEMRVRSWKWTPGDWPQSLVLVLGALAIFARFYYPHIKASWGGGTPIPITLTMTKDSVVLAVGELVAS